MLYKYALIDAQYILTRNFHQAKKNPNFSQQELVKSFFYSIVKLVREDLKCDKVVLLWDKYPYHKSTMLEDFKGDRVYHDEKDLEKPDLTDEERARIAESIRLNKIKGAAKYFILTNLGNFGMPSFMKKGYEADDLAYLFSKNYKEEKKSVIVSADSDWTSMTSDKVDHYMTKRKVFYTYQYGIEKTSADNVTDLYELMTIHASLFGSHNNLTQTLTKEGMKLSYAEKIRRAQSGEFEGLINNVDLFKRQVKSFSVMDYPESDKAKNMFYFIDKNGILGSQSAFDDWSFNNGLFINSQYYKTFIKDLDTSLYDK